ncbi:phage tail assembly chaperone [Sandarakinorhabdus sp. DWP1-3-1]|uniref:phage tail assembly chaperone n=1 Tax=Sandarakinorhabdus sp. DWP1-3-1 TaxID=2804627 RepID=UPI003CECF163
MNFALAALRAARIAAGALGWRPDDFWAATPADLRNALGLDDVGEPADGSLLSQLMESFPDDR